MLCAGGAFLPPACRLPALLPSYDRPAYENSGCRDAYIVCCDAAGRSSCTQASQPFHRNNDNHLPPAVRRLIPPACCSRRSICHSGLLLPCHIAARGAPPARGPAAGHRYDVFALRRAHLSGASRHYLLLAAAAPATRLCFHVPPPRPPTTYYSPCGRNVTYAQV